MRRRPCGVLVTRDQCGRTPTTYPALRELASRLGDETELLGTAPAGLMATPARVELSRNRRTTTGP